MTKVYLAADALYLHIHARIVATQLKDKDCF